MIRKFINILSAMTIMTSLLVLMACGSESDISHYEEDWSELEDEIEYRMDNVDLQPTEEVDIEYLD